jgi:hypothetical protein
MSSPPKPRRNLTQPRFFERTDRCRPTEVCRQLKVPWITFNHWQHWAMEGMLQALEPRVNLTKGEAFSPRLQQLLQRQQRQHGLTDLRQSEVATPSKKTG